jgi:hypothetical protein
MRDADRLTYDRSQPPIRKRVLEKVESAAAHQFDSNRELRIASDHHDREWKLSATNLVDQPSQSNARKVEGRENASRGGCGNFVEELCGVVVTLYDNRLARECVNDAAALIGMRVDDIDGFGHEPLGPANGGRVTR